MQQSQSRSKTEEGTVPANQRPSPIQAKRGQKEGEYRTGGARAESEKLKEGATQMNKIQPTCKLHFLGLLKTPIAVKLLPLAELRREDRPWAPSPTIIHHKLPAASTCRGQSQVLLPVPSQRVSASMAQIQPNPTGQERV
ncbi:hypothetical protein MHYP_G00024050 [Metynnis hypsauchen]